MRRFAIIGAVAALLAVIFGALGAHALKTVLSPAHLSAFHTAVNYQMYHGLALLILAVTNNYTASKFAKLAGYFFVSGILLFSGSIYLLTLAKWTLVGPVTPIGGVCLMVGWICLILGLVKGAAHE
ncbi:DUF423 domain-containing protein [Alteromonas sp. C1M14]|uniref:DUF423 domain-containing protein n=1 Tax=Alteromonas sp. C1M14 TaxID=2841567 RepID=UPI001C09697D|nr:DUF423 domain-containing protein [Alteromonas sp. C1M14]MBU2978885.1 DUF423 domain-containing protein [Alteromonas sp. C1M14]